MPDPHALDQEIQQAETAIKKADRWLSLGVACRRLGFTRHTAYRWIEHGRFGRRVRQLPTGRWQVSEAALEKIESDIASAQDSGANGATGASA